MTIAPRSFRYALDGATAVATITLNRPDRLNALTFEVYRELLEVFRALDTEPDVRAIVITGSGRAFCSGGDVEDIIGALFEQDKEGLLEFTRMTCDVIAVSRQGYEFRRRAWCDHDAGGVRRDVPRHPLEWHGEFEQLVVLRRALAYLG